MKNDLNNMMCLDLYFSSLETNEIQALQKAQSLSKMPVMPLSNWDIFSTGRFLQQQNFRKNQDIIKVQNLGKKFNWQQDINELFKNEDFEAVILTDVHQKIIWVNKGFTRMTGYSKKEALYRTPQFLQGPESCEATKESIRRKLKRNEPFTEVIINYKKNKDDYKCEVNIFPLYNEHTTHFIALEKQIS